MSNSRQIMFGRAWTIILFYYSICLLTEAEFSPNCSGGSVTQTWERELSSALCSVAEMERLSLWWPFRLLCCNWSHVTRIKNFLQKKKERTQFFPISTKKKQRNKAGAQSSAPSNSPALSLLPVVVYLTSAKKSQFCHTRATEVHSQSNSIRAFIRERSIPNFPFTGSPHLWGSSKV